MEPNHAPAMSREVATSCCPVGRYRSLRADPRGQVASSPVKHIFGEPPSPVTSAVLRAEMQYLCHGIEYNSTGGSHALVCTAIRGRSGIVLYGVCMVCRTTHVTVMLQIQKTWEIGGTHYVVGDEMRCSVGKMRYARGTTFKRSKVLNRTVQSIKRMSAHNAS